MKLTNENINKLGIGLEIEVPDEIQDRDGKWYEIIEYRGIEPKDIYCSSCGYVYVAMYCSSHEYPILRQIIKPTKEWLAKNEWRASEKPMIVKVGDKIYECEGTNGWREICNRCPICKDLIGKRRFILTKVEKVELPPKLPPTCFEKYWFGLNDLPLPKPEGKNINQIVNHHWSDGGTGITNFEADEWPVYLQAVKEYGDKDLILVSNPMPPMRNNGAGALHRMNRPFNSDLSAFWEIHRRIQKELSKPISEPEHRASNCVKLSDNGYVPLACIGRDCTTCPDWILKVTKCPTCGKEIK